MVNKPNQSLHLTLPQLSVAGAVVRPCKRNSMLRRLPQALITASFLLAVPVRAADLCDPSALAASRATVLSQVCLALAAVNKGNAATLRRLMAEDFALTSVNGKYFEKSKQGMITRWTEASPVGTTASSKLTKVYRTAQSAAFGFVAGEIEDKTMDKYGSHCAVHAFTDIWELRADQWQWVQSHESGERSQACTD
jgi:hypothetical protein